MNTIEAPAASRGLPQLAKRILKFIWEKFYLPEQQGLVLHPQVPLNLTAMAETIYFHRTGSSKFTSITIFAASDSKVELGLE